tara:strand:+ start:287 stop:472 length:186 start_codon:yes stop_codon:yes gene_type:complete
MYEIKVTLTDKQYNLLSEALFYYSEEKDNVTKDIEELEDLIDISTIKVKRDRKYLNPDCDI